MVLFPWKALATNKLTSTLISGRLTTKYSGKKPIGLHFFTDNNKKQLDRNKQQVSEQTKNNEENDGEFDSFSNVVENKLSAKSLKRLMKRVVKDDMTKEYFQSRGIPLSLLVARKACRDEQLQRNLANILSQYTESSPTTEEAIVDVKRDEISGTFHSDEENDKVILACLPVLAKYLEDKYPKQVHAHHRILKVVDLSRPEDWYPLARNIQRKVILHIGPTNSGKTHAALEALRTAKSGIYCGPLRLLAWEVHERLNKGDENHHPVPCDLLTGQEQTEIPNAQHISCTVEMAPVHTRFQVGVIDEVCTFHID